MVATVVAGFALSARRGFVRGRPPVPFVGSSTSGRSIQIGVLLETARTYSPPLLPQSRDFHGKFPRFLATISHFGAGSVANAIALR